MRKLFVLALMSLALSAQTLVTVTGPVKKIDGTDWTGQLIITNQPMFCGSYHLPKDSIRANVTSGTLSVQVYATVGCGTGQSYSVQYLSSGRTVQTAYWVVPLSPTTTTVGAVQTTTIPTPALTVALSQLGSPGYPGTVIMSNGTSWVAGSVLADSTTTTGDLLYKNSSGILTRLGIGSSGQFFRVSGGIPAWQTVTTDSVTEGSTNLYHTTARVRAALSATSPISYDSSTGVISCPTCGTGSGAVDSVFGRTGAVVAQSGDYSSYYSAVGHQHPVTDVTSGVFGLARGGTNNATWTAGRCVQVSSDGTKLEVAAAACGTGGGTVSSIQSASASLTSQTSVTVTHNFNSLNQVVACRDGSAVEVKPSTVTVGLSATVIAFTTAQTGSCTILGGTGLYSQSFTSQTSVTLSHGLGTQAVIAACYDSSNVLVEPSSFTATSTSAATVTFGSAQTGACVVAAGLAGGSGGGSEYTLPTASADTLGGVKVGTGLAITDGVLAVSGGAGTVTTGSGLTGDGSSGSPVRIDPSGGAASQAIYTASLSSWGTIGAASCVEKSITATGATAGATLATAYPATIPTGIIGMMYAATDVVVVRLCNVTAAGVAVSDGLTFSARVISGF